MQSDCGILRQRSLKEAAVNYEILASSGALSANCGPNAPQPRQIRRGQAHFSQQPAYFLCTTLTLPRKSANACSPSRLRFTPNSLVGFRPGPLFRPRPAFLQPAPTVSLQLHYRRREDQTTLLFQCVSLFRNTKTTNYGTTHNSAYHQ